VTLRVEGDETNVDVDAAAAAYRERTGYELRLEWV